ncbi:hypothetical protein POM88_015854 [Heracleum sosnowskyi]|uniref:Retrotransposon gag domain-containing protein n=1 Tax=Heracleum sosnowskyi TaxID=360622 RepID=A0AAD8MW95_9APIA|nr:hypothetical protein POM88_015854 [Heracleum sosnowskyi]
MDSTTKVIYAALYLEDEADYWYQTVQAEYPGLGWEAFSSLLLRRFSTGNQGNLIGKFNKLTQTCSVDNYIAKFEELRGYMMITYSLHIDEFYFSSFLSGLRANIPQALYIYKPVTLQEAIDKAKEQEIFIDMIEKRMKGQAKPRYSTTYQPKPSFEASPLKSGAGITSPSFSSGRTNSTLDPPKHVGNSSSSSRTPMIRRISPSEMAKRREKGLCYNCDEIYSPGHKCTHPQLYLMIGDSDASDQALEESTLDITTGEENNIEEGGQKLHLQQPTTNSSHFQVLLDSEKFKSHKEQVCFLVQLTAVETTPEATNSIPFPVQQKEDLKSSWETDAIIHPILTQLAIDPGKVPDYTLEDDLR